jgi:hypothetical protein
MHIHQSIVDVKTRKNIFSNPDGTPSPLFFSHIGGLQKYLPAAMALFCANVNSYRRLTRYRRAVHRRLLHRQGSRVRGVPAGDQLLGARAPAVECVRRPQRHLVPIQPYCQATEMLR